MSNRTTAWPPRASVTSRPRPGSAEDDKMRETIETGGFGMVKVGARRLLMLLAGLAIVFTGCATPPAPRTSGGNAPDAAPAPARSAAPKTLRMASIREPVEGVVFFNSGNILGQFHWIFH